MPTIKLTWRCKRDLLSCTVCRALDGYTWIFDVKKKKKLPDVPVHPVYGTLWGLDWLL